MSSIWNPQDRYLLSNMTSEKLYAKSPLTTGVSGTSAYIGLEPSATYNETVLWSGSPSASNVNINLSEPISGFERFAVEWRSYARFYHDELFGDSNTPTIALGAVFVNTDGAYEKSLTTWTTNDGQTYTWRATIHGAFTANQNSTFNQYVVPLKIVGINRKEV